MPIKIPESRGPFTGLADSPRVTVEDQERGSGVTRAPKVSPNPAKKWSMTFCADLPINALPVLHDLVVGTAGRLEREVRAAIRSIGKGDLCGALGLAEEAAAPAGQSIGLGGYYIVEAEVGRERRVHNAQADLELEFQGPRSGPIEPLAAGDRLPELFSVVRPARRLRRAALSACRRRGLRHDLLDASRSGAWQPARSALALRRSGRTRPESGRADTDQSHDCRHSGASRGGPPTVGATGRL